MLYGYKKVSNHISKRGLMESFCWMNKILCFICILIAAHQASARAKLTREQVPPTEIDDHGCQCVWTHWMNNNDYVARVGDNNTYANLRRWYDFCEVPRDIKCREKYNWAVPFHLLSTGGSKCDVTSGMLCVSRPFNPKRRRRKFFYCDDFEITVQCCYCPTTTALPTTVPEILSTTAAVFPPGEIVEFNIPENRTPVVSHTVAVNATAASSISAPPHDMTITLILIVIFGCIVIAVFVAIIWLVLLKSGLNRKKIPHQNFYYEAPPIEEYSPIKARIEHASMKQKALVSSSGSVDSSELMTSSSEDEGYRSRPSYSQKRRTKGERNRKLNGSRGNPGDSLELTYPSVLQHSSVEESSDESRFRKWFPDEYERSLQQKRNLPPPKQKTIFNPPFTANNRKSIPFMDDSVS